MRGKLVLVPRLPLDLSRYAIAWAGYCRRFGGASVNVMIFSGKFGGDGFLSGFCFLRGSVVIGRFWDVRVCGGGASTGWTSIID